MPLDSQKEKQEEKLRHLQILAEDEHFNYLLKGDWANLLESAHRDALDETLDDKVRFAALIRYKTRAEMIEFVSTQLKTLLARMNQPQRSGMAG